jgi:hypothetical protein
MAGPTIKPVSMSTIKSRLLQPALTSHFICEFTPPPSANNFLNAREGAGFIGATYSLKNQELIQLSCSEASLPGSSLATNEINNDYTGVTERHAYRRLYDDRSDFTFYVDKEHRIIDFFENWISYVVNESDLEAQQNRTYNYRVNFPQGPTGYQTDNLFITKFERDYKGRPLTYKFMNAYPISINSMPVSYDSSQLLKCTVSFTYSRYVISRDPAQITSATEEPSAPVSNQSATLYGPKSNDIPQTVTLQDGRPTLAQLYDGV